MLCWLLLLTINVTAQQSPDSLLYGVPFGKDFLQLKNNNLLFGRIRKISRSELLFDPDGLNDVTVKLKDIAQLAGPYHFYRIETLAGDHFIARLYPTESPGYTLLKGIFRVDSILLEQVYSLKQWEKNIWRGLDGKISFGYSYTKSSDITRLNFNNDLNYTAANWTYAQQSSAIYTLNKETIPLERADVLTSASWNFKPKWLNIYRLQYQRQIETGVASRYISAIAVGRSLLRNRNINWSATIGISLQRENPTDNSPTQTQAEVPLLVNFNLFQWLKPDVDITAYANFYFNLSEKGRYRLDHKINLEYEPVKDFVISIQFFFNYDSRPPAINTSTNDFGTVLNLGFKF
ncbi:hypothetical protein BUE76_14690 [Cnuella takakiae]|nr:hypothetical protein BUE76_14690 [Cnuella takakiae]